MSSVQRSTFPVYDRDQGLGGIGAPTTFWAAPGQTLATANRAYFARVVPSRSMTIVNISFGVAGAANNDDAVDVGLYDATGAKIITAGATTGKANATGQKKIAITSTTLTAGTTYFAAFSYGAVGGTAATLATAGVSDSSVAKLFNTVIGTHDAKSTLFIKGTSHPLPSSFTFGSVSDSAVCVALGLLES